MQRPGCTAFLEAWRRNGKGGPVVVAICGEVGIVVRSQERDELDGKPSVGKACDILVGTANPNPSG